MTREEAINAITAFVENYASGSDLVGLRTAIEALKEPKHGEWINTGEAIGDDIEVKCSLCGEELYWLANFCPNCGASMRKEGDEK